MTTDEVMAELADRGLRVEMRQGGPVLVGDRIQVTPTLLAVLRWHKADIAARTARPKPTALLREWLFPRGMTVREESWFCSAGDAGQHPHRAVAWRYVGQEEWRSIPGRDEGALAKGPPEDESWVPHEES